jgi:hypothetical protein
VGREREKREREREKERERERDETLKKDKSFGVEEEAKEEEGDARQP